VIKIDTLTETVRAKRIALEAELQRKMEQIEASGALDMSEEAKKEHEEREKIFFDILAEQGLYPHELASDVDEAIARTENRIRFKELHKDVTPREIYFKHK